MLYTLNPWRPVSAAIEEIIAENDLGLKLTGSSGQGWSYWSTLQQCPQRFLLAYHRYDSQSVPRPSLESPDRAALSVGSLIHAFRALHYYQAKLEGWEAAYGDGAWIEWLYDQLGAKRVNPEHLEEAYRVFTNYKWFYSDKDPVLFRPLEVEYEVRDKVGSSCRYDALVELLEDVGPNPAGVYVNELKSTGRFGQETYSWDLDGEIIGQVALYQRLRLWKKFGPLRGVIVDIAGKQKQNPLCMRIFVSPPDFRVREHIRTLRHLRAMRHKFEREGYWPRYMASCINRWGMCDYYEHCLHNKTMDTAPETAPETWEGTTDDAREDQAGL
jgi:hypothetical protein